MGQLPAVFAGDRTLAESFIDSLKAYFRLNHQAPNFQSYLTRIALALTLLQGPLVAEWARHTGNWLELQDPTMDDTQDTWNQFETQFLTTFTDSQRDQRAQNQLETLRMKWPLIDQYTMDFEKLVREAGYQKGTPECEEPTGGSFKEGDVGSQGDKVGRSERGKRRGERTTM